MGYGPAAENEAEILGRPPRVVNEIIAGKRGISPETAMELSEALGTSAQFWMNLETVYQLSKARPPSRVISQKAMLREKFPVREMIRRGWIEATEDLNDLAEKLEKFFRLNSLDEPLHFPHAARRNYTSDLSTIQLAWLFRVKQIAEAMPLKKFSEASLRAALPKLEAFLTEPEESRHVARVLAECGVCFVIVEPVPGSKIDGVCFWINGGRTPVIGLTLRYDRNDNFWFVLRHEIEHVLRGDGKTDIVIDEDVGQANPDISEEEKAADDAAGNFCVPTVEMDSFIARVQPFFSEKTINGFARRIGRHPGIVVGQLQHRLNRNELLNKLKSKIRAHVTSSALTDGWGEVAPV
jgi:HTH-type transcriptional regulator/antitoxin HigA